MAPERTDKNVQLDGDRVDPQGSLLTTDQGIAIGETDNSLRVGERGPMLMEDFHFREKLTHYGWVRSGQGVVTAEDSVTAELPKRSSTPSPAHRHPGRKLDPVPA